MAMDSLITSAALALARGDPLGALNRVALRDDAPALALRGIAMAQLGDLERAKGLLRRAARAFGPKQTVSRARCVVAEVEIALVSRDLGSVKTLEAARRTLEEHGDHANAAYARHLQIRLLLLFGRLDEAEQACDQLDPTFFAPAFKAAHELVIAGIAMRRLRTKDAEHALARAQDAARLAQIPPLMAEVEKAALALNTPAARLITRDGEKPLLLAEVEALLASPALVVDACRYLVRRHNDRVALAKRPVLFALVRTLAEAWPKDVSRDSLIAQTFRLKLSDETHRARLRVEIGRLRTAIIEFAEVRATPQGFLLVPRSADKVVVLDQPIREKHAAVLAILTDGEAWSSSALALVLGTSQRTVQRALDALAEAGKVQAFGRGQACRWVSSTLPGFTTTLLLPGPLPSH
jgi:tetratricopeptide (TPR) repeat protein